MFTKLSNFIKRTIYALPFGLKSADNEISNGNSINSGSEIVIGQETQDKTVAKHLLKGEITESVEELRYRMYKVEEESQNYEYLGNGIAVKKEKPKNQRQKTRFKFTQRNRLLVTGVLDELERVDSYGQENYTIEIGYSSFPRFQLNEFIDRIQVDANLINSQFLTTLVFSTIPNQYNTKSKPFINELMQLKDINLDSEYAAARNIFLSGINSISFSTYKANGEDDFTNYSFLGECKVKKIDFTENECLITYEWSEMLRFPLGKLSEKYDSKTMREKYEKKVTKENDFFLEPLKKKTYCKICGNEIEEGNTHKICNACFRKIKKKKH